jgi:hypothetical protein
MQQNDVIKIRALSSFASFAINGNIAAKHLSTLLLCHDFEGALIFPI